MSSKNYVIVEKGCNYVATPMNSIRKLSAKKRKEAKRKAGKVIFYGVNEMDYERLQAIHDALSDNKRINAGNKLRMKLLREAIRDTLKKSLGK